MSVKLEIAKKEYVVAFDYRAAKHISESFGVDSYGAVQQMLIDTGLDNIGLDLSFPQYEFLSKLTLYAIQAHPSNDATSLKCATIEKHLFNHLDEAMEILKHYMDVTYKRMGKLAQNPEPQK